MIVDNGQWWMPSDSDHTGAGDLTTVHDGSLRLKLGCRVVPKTDSNHITVWGVTDDATPVTLLGCLVLSAEESTQEVYVHAALIGAHIASGDDQIFRRVSVSLSNLTDWATRGHDRPPLPDHINNPQCPGEQLSLRRVGSEVQLVIESDEPRRWMDFDTTIRAFEDLLTLAGSADCRVESAVLSTSEGIRVQLRMKAEHVIERRWHPVFVLGTVPDRFISDWLTLRAQLGMSGSVLFSVDYGGPGYFQNKLFNVASAAEGIHQILCPTTTGISDQEHHELKAYIKALPEGPVRRWALSATQRNQPGFAARMRELASIPDSEAVATVLHNKAMWVTWMVNARNAIGHSSWDGMEKIPREVRPALTYVTKTLLHLVMLERLGLSPEQQRNAAPATYYNLRQRYEDYFDSAPVN
ncbi:MULTISPECIES: HEPN domain-containing protein [Rhodococcus]|uniref:ApeA N-terminal domain-containing protein n=1 Tax=Rhodococcus cerastii TaxID=908616 RepID=A0ABU4CXL9_9NOCA|nr:MULTISPECIES: HEPN domain-containing protein [Rhodococcus]KAA0927908.1 hypothetical protein FQ188_02165 [Rhodococcus sp. ANT_H53B]MDI9925616.1 hypothetical protein [Rhodococcus sp. IEGM 1341]MDV6302229.1 hypothetical protein [Rhodococcus cerastii]MDV8057890.1 hypothetical protein [Rhodococcus sp. IEGM 1343]